MASLKQNRGWWHLGGPWPPEILMRIAHDWAMASEPLPIQPDGRFVRSHNFKLVGGLEHFLFSHILGIIIPID